MEVKKKMYVTQFGALKIKSVKTNERTNVKVVGQPKTKRWRASFNTTFIGPKSIAGVPFDSVSRFRLPYYCTPLVCISVIIE